VNALALLLLLFADEHAGLREFIDARRTERGRQEVELVLPAEAPPVPRNPLLVWESIDYPYPGVFLRLVRFLPEAGGTVRVLRVSNRPEPGAPSLREFAGRTEVARIDRARFDALVRDLLLIREAKLVRHKGKPVHGRWQRLSAFQVARVRVWSGTQAVLELSGIVRQSRSLVANPLDEFSDAERLVLSMARIDADIQALEFERVPLPEHEAQRLLKELAAERILERRWIDAVRMRMDVLASNGYRNASEELRLIEKWERSLYPLAQRALARIEYVGAKDPKASLLAAMADRANSDAGWAAAAARQVYPVEYRTWLERRVAKGDRSVLKRLRRLTTVDAELARRGLTPSDAGREAAAALTVWEITKEPREIAKLIAIARDKRLRAPAERAVRWEMIGILQELWPGDVRVRDALLMIAVDVTEAADLRDHAVTALRDYPGERTVAVLQALQRKAPSASVAETLRTLAGR